MKKCVLHWWLLVHWGGLFCGLVQVYVNLFCTTVKTCWVPASKTELLNSICVQPLVGDTWSGSLHTLETNWQLALEVVAELAQNLFFLLAKSHLCLVLQFLALVWCLPYSTIENVSCLTQASNDFFIRWVVQVFQKLEFLTHFQLLHELLLPRLCNLIRHLQIKMICKKMIKPTSTQFFKKI